MLPPSGKRVDRPPALFQPVFKKRSESRRHGVASKYKIGARYRVHSSGGNGALWRDKRSRTSTGDRFWGSELLTHTFDSSNSVFTGATTTEAAGASVIRVSDRFITFTHSKAEQ
jgi:hypothetical protein